MGNKRSITQVDFDFGIGSIIPSTQEAFKREFQNNIRKSESANLAVFKEKLVRDLEIRLKRNAQFPTQNEVFVFILQYFVSPKQYKSRDVDALKISGLERSVTLFQELKSQGIL